jgi:hypothetical protein
MQEYTYINSVGRQPRQTIHVTTTTYIFSLHCSVHVVGSPAFLKKISSENRLFTAYDIVQGVECLKFL